MVELALREIFESRKMRQGRDGLEVTVVYQVNTPDPDQAITVAPAYGADYPFDKTVDGLEEAKCVEVDVEPFETRCKMTVRYAPLDRRQAPIIGGELWEWDAVAQQQTIYNVKRWDDQISYPTQYTTMSIGVDGENVTGVSAYRPYRALTVSKEYMGFSTTQRQVVESLSTTVNSKQWPTGLGWYAPGEVLYLGATISKAPGQRWRVQYRFIIGKHQENVVFDLIGGGAYLASEIKAWQYTWTQMAQEQFDIGSETHFRQGIKSVHIANIYEEADFRPLGLKGPSVFHV